MQHERLLATQKTCQEQARRLAWIPGVMDDAEATGTVKPMDANRAATTILDVIRAIGERRDPC